MVVYIEDAIIDNTVINFIILALSLFSLRLKNKYVKTLFASLFGCAISFFITYFNFNQNLIILIKILTGIIMCSIVIPKFTFKTLSLFFIVFLSFTFLLGGFCFFIIYLLGGEIYSLQTMQYNLPISLGAIIFLIAVYTYFLIKAIQVFYKKQKLSSFYYVLHLKINNKTKKIKAYLDTGNLLQDNQTGLPIIIISFKTLLMFFGKDLSIIDFLTLKLNHKIKGKYIQVNSVSGKSKMFVFEPTEVFVCEKGQPDKKINVLIGVSSFGLAQENFEALLNPLAI